MPTVALPVVSALTAGVLIIGQIGPLLIVVLMRRGLRQALGDGGQPIMLRAIRRHGNFAENAAIFLVALTLLEMFGAARWVVAWPAIVFVLGRISHAIGLSQTNTINIWRIAGIVGTVGPAVTVGVRLVLLAAGHLGA
jgi:uncharacterized membrane protein YecN with MAPEG domain